MTSPGDRRRVLICDCEGTMPLDAKALGKALDDKSLTIHSQLCRDQIGRFADAIKGEAPVVVACTQEAPLFAETADQASAPAPLSFCNIRERAGWSVDAKNVMPKIAALLAEAMLDAPMTPSVTLSSAGSVLVYGEGADALETAGQLAERMDATALVKDGTSDTPPAVTSFAVFQGTIEALSGHLGQFDVTIRGMASSAPSSRDTLRFGDAAQKTGGRFDIVLDLTRDPALVTAPEKRDGYFKRDPRDPAGVQKALFEITNLVGEFEKPRYVKFDASVCVHSRSQLTGCTRCLDVCPAGAITSAGDHVDIDPFVCGGCGSCAAVCPTGASSYALPPSDFVLKRLRTLLATYHENGGAKAVVLIHDGQDGADLIMAVARHGKGLPANVIPFAVNETTQVGLETLAGAMAYGAAAVRVMVPPRRLTEADGLAGQIELAETFLDGLGYGTGRVAMLAESDPDVLEAALFDAAGTAPEPAKAGSFLAMGSNRAVTGLALAHLHEHAPQPVDALALPDGAPFGTVEVNAEGCTLCLSCVGACPTGAFVDNPDEPQLGFVESACVQCGLCRVTCPEKVITLSPRYDFTDAARRTQIKHREEPFQCVSCGTPFGVRSTIEAMVDKLKGHAMFQDEGALDRIRMCPDCRVSDMSVAGDPTFGVGPRARTRTSEDYRTEDGDETAKPSVRSRGNGQE